MENLTFQNMFAVKFVEKSFWKEDVNTGMRISRPCNKSKHMRKKQERHEKTAMKSSKRIEKSDQQALFSF